MIRKKRIHLNTVAADEFYTYYDGVIYNNLYSGDVDEEEMVTFVWDFIVQNTIQELDFDRKYEGWGSIMWVLAVVGILLVCFIIVLFYSANLKDKSKKVKVLIFGLGLLFIITPLISGAIAMITILLEGDGFAGIGMFVLVLPIGIVVSLLITIYGIVLFIKDRKS